MGEPCRSLPPRLWALRLEASIVKAADSSSRRRARSIPVLGRLCRLHALSLLDCRPVEGACGSVVSGLLPQVASLVRLRRLTVRSPRSAVGPVLHVLSGLVCLTNLHLCRSLADAAPNVPCSLRQLVLELCARGLPCIAHGLTSRLLKGCHESNRSALATVATLTALRSFAAPRGMPPLPWSTCGPAGASLTSI